MQYPLIILLDKNVLHIAQWDATNSFWLVLFQFHGSEQAAEYTEILISKNKNKNIAFLSVSVGYSLIPTRGRCTVHRRLQPTIGLIPSTDTQKQMYSSDRVGMAHVKLGRVRFRAERRLATTSPFSPLSLAWLGRLRFGWWTEWTWAGWCPGLQAWSLAGSDKVAGRDRSRGKKGPSVPITPSTSPP